MMVYTLKTDWLRYLSEDEIEELFAELEETIKEAARTKDLSALYDLLEDWEETAYIHSCADLERGIEESIDEADSGNFKSISC